MRRRLASLLLPLGLVACGPSQPLSGLGGRLNPPAPAETRPSLDVEIRSEVQQAEARGCDYLVSEYCFFPWPNDHFTVADPRTDTGRRVNLDLAAMPRNIVGLPLRPEEWNRNDGFSPGQMLVSFVPGLDPEASGLPDVRDITASLAAGSPLVVIDAETGERHPVWAEIDASDTAQTLCEAPEGVVELLGFVAGEVGLEALVEGLRAAIEPGGAVCAAALQPVLAAVAEALHGTGLAPNSALKVDPPALLMRPGINFKDGRRYIVALRNLKRADGSVIEAPATFRVFRDRHASGLAAIEARRPRMEALFERLESAGVARGELYMAWDFTVASTRNLAGRLLHMRDTALAEIGGAAPPFQIDEVIDFEQGASIRRVLGRYEVPNFLTLPDGLCDNLPILSDLALLDYCAALERLSGTLAGAPGLSAVLGPAAEALGLLLELGQLPGSRLYYGLAGGELPQINPFLPRQTVRFQCEIPRTAVGRFDDPDTWLRPATPTLYGHGLLGGKGEVGGGSTARLREQNLMHCAIDWIGMATRDVPTVLTLLLDMGNFPTLPDRVQQSVVNWHVLTRLLRHPQGLGSHPAFQTADGASVFDPTEVVYDGNSQGGIIGGVVMATSAEVTRGVLGVPGMNYSTLLRRSVDFDVYGAIFYTAYPNSFDQSFILSLIQMLWDRAETNGYANHLTRPEAFNALGHPTPEHQVMLHVAFADHQVADVTAEIMARVFDAGMHRPGTEPGRHTNVNPYWGIRDAVEGEDGSIAIFWDIGPLGNPFNPGTEPSPPTNIPPREGRDPHSDPRAEVAGGIQRAAFLLDRRYLNVCADRPCFARDYLSEPVASGQAGNRAPLVRAPGPLLMRPGSTAPLVAIAADPDREALSLSWSFVTPPACEARIETSEDGARLALGADCRAALTLEVEARDGAGNTARHRLTVMPRG